MKKQSSRALVGRIGSLFITIAVTLSAVINLIYRAGIEPPRRVAIAAAILGGLTLFLCVSSKTRWIAGILWAIAALTGLVVLIGGIGIENRDWIDFAIKTLAVSVTEVVFLALWDHRDEE
jgi:hypothetical protein